MRKKNGFTLVELLAVIVVLAIIMIIAIPNVLDAMNNARRNSFVLYLEKVYKDVKTQYTSDSGLSGTISGPGLYVYSISKEDLGYETKGSYAGYILVDASGDNIDDPKYIISMWDANYQLLNYNISTHGTDGLVNDTANLKDVVKNDVSFNEQCFCQRASGSTDSVCYTRKGYQITGDGCSVTNKPQTNEDDNNEENNG